MFEVNESPEMQKAKVVAKRLRQAGATHCQMVGGCVRDLFLKLPSKDIDIEVYGITYQQITEALQGEFRVDLVGRSFGVVKVDNEIDVSLPRTETKLGMGHTDFQIHADPNLTPRQAAARRDFTINAIAMDFKGQIFDPFDGCRDLELGILRATSPAFAEDPLRVMRAMQFAARFGFTLESDTSAYCRQLRSEFASLSIERVWDEWMKWAVRGKHPSQGLRVLKATGWINCFPVLDALVGTPQDPGWHPEGDVFEHTCHVCDAAVEIADREQLGPTDRAALMFSALCHDFGKPTTTVQNAHGRWTAPRHAEVGGELSADFLRGLRSPIWLQETVVPLVVEHMAHMGTNESCPPTERQVRRLSMRLAPVTVRLWSTLVEADASGRPPLQKQELGKMLPID